MNEKKRKRFLIVLKFSFKTNFLLLFFRLFQKFSLNLWKKKSKSLLSLFFLSWKWKSFTRDKTFQRFDNFVKISLTWFKVRRFRLFNSSIILTILFVEKYNFANIWRSLLIVSMFRCLCFFVSLSKKRSEILLSILWDSRFQDHLMSFSLRLFLMSFFFSTFSTFFDALSIFSIFLNVAFSSTRFFASLSNDYCDSFSVFRFRFLSKISQKKSHVSFHFSFNLKKKSVKYFSNF